MVVLLLDGQEDLTVELVGPAVVNLQAIEVALGHGTGDPPVVFDPGEIASPGRPTSFEEPGALDQVARLAREWFEQILTPPGHIRERENSIR